LGVATRNAITAALLAAEGFTSAKSVFDGPYNIFQIFAGIIPPSDWVQKIGIEFQVVHASLKKYSAGRPIHAVLDALSLIEKEQTFDLRDVARVDVSMPPETAKIVDKNPTISIDCQYIVAKALTEGVKSLIYDMQDKVNNRSYQELMSKISIVYDESLSKYYPEHWPAIIRIHLSKGRILEKQVVHVSGSKSNPMSKEEILSKFHSLSQPILGEKRVHDIITLMNSEKKNMRQLIKILTMD
jgi:2-methylcitrate dehydratase PrpD